MGKSILTKLTVVKERWPQIVPFSISGYIFDAVDVIVVTLEREGLVGRAEATGVYYRGDGCDLITAQIEGLRPQIERGIDRHVLQSLLPPGGARNALDVALWDLEAQISRVPVWRSCGLAVPVPVCTAFTCGADAPEKMVDQACGYSGARIVKLKLTGETIDAARVLAVRSALPDVRLAVDANQGFTREFYKAILPTLVEADVTLIEQPFPVGSDSWLDNLERPISIAADESVQCLDDLGRLAGRYDLINVKLDKCGGLTEALRMVAAARSLGIGVMVGNMMGTSLAMAPAYIVGQHCDLADLDGPVFLTQDRCCPVEYRDGFIECPEALWGNPR